MQLTKTKERTFFDKDRELIIKDGTYTYKGVDVTSIVEAKGTDFISIMGKVGAKSYHNYFGLDKNKWYRFTGVTSALDYVGDKNNLMQWYANQVVAEFGWSKQLPGEDAATYKGRVDAAMSQKLVEFDTLSFPDRIDFIKKARTAASQYVRKTANLGKGVHEEIEKLIKFAISASGGQISPLTKHTNEQVQHFIDWATKNKVIFKVSELKVFSRKYWFAGTCDLVIEIDGSLFLGDIKTTSSVWGRSYFAQCAAYRLALEEMYPDKYKFAGSIIIRIGRDGLFNAEEDVHFSQFYEDDKKYFLAGLEVYRQENNMYKE